MTTDSFAHKIELDQPYEQAIETVTGALKEEGFGILTEIDVKETLKEKLGVDFRRYVILGACNPPLAHQALSHELEIGLLLPCNAIVYEKDDGSSVAGFLDPMAMFTFVEKPGMDEVAQEAAQRIERVAASLQG